MVAGAAFCASCGKPATPAMAVVPPISSSVRSGLQSNVAGALCYVVGLVSGICFLVADPYRRDPFVRFHALQSIFLSIVSFVAYFVIGVLTAAAPYALSRLLWMLHSLLGLAFLLLWLFLMYKAYNHEQFKLPILGERAAKQA